MKASTNYKQSSNNPPGYISMAYNGVLEEDGVKGLSFLLRVKFAQRSLLCKEKLGRRRE